MTLTIIILIAGAILSFSLIRSQPKEKTMENTNVDNTNTNFLDKEFDLKEEIIRVAKEELKKHPTYGEEYEVTWISKEGEGDSVIYTVSLDVLSGTKDKAVWVKIKYIDNAWKAVGFFRGRA